MLDGQRNLLETARALSDGYTQEFPADGCCGIGGRSVLCVGSSGVSKVVGIGHCNKRCAKILIHHHKVYENL